MGFHVGPDSPPELFVCVLKSGWMKVITSTCTYSVCALFIHSLFHTQFDVQGDSLSSKLLAHKLNYVSLMIGQVFTDGQDKDCWPKDCYTLWVNSQSP